MLWLFFVITVNSFPYRTPTNSHLPRFSSLSFVRIKRDRPVSWSTSDDYSFEIDRTVDLYGDQLDEDEALLKIMRFNKTIANDRWQSNIFREANCGKWKGRIFL